MKASAQPLKTTHKTNCRSFVPGIVLILASFQGTPGASGVIQGGLPCGTDLSGDDYEGDSNVTSSEVASDIPPKTVLLAASLSPHSALFPYSNYYDQTLYYIPFFIIATLPCQNRSFLRAVTVFFTSLFPVPRTVPDTKQVIVNIDP